MRLVAMVVVVAGLAYFTLDALQTGDWAGWFVFAVFVSFEVIVPLWRGDR
jgi:hypothetical protein